jgi:hypothetical protein
MRSFAHLLPLGRMLGTPVEAAYKLAILASATWLVVSLGL